MLRQFLYLVLVLISTIHIKAQNGLSEDSLRQELIITHSKTPISIKSSYKPTMIIERATIDHHLQDDISSLLDDQLGLTVSGAYSNPAKDKSIFLQGAGGEYTLILMDGIPITDPSGIGGSFDLRSISLSQIERIEIVKGGQSALYGSDAIAGVINIITREDSDSKSSGGMKAIYGTLDTKDVSAYIDLPIADALDFHIDGSYTQSDGISEALDVTGTANFDKDGFDRNAVNSSLSWSPTKELKFRPFVRYSHFDGDFDSGAFADGAGHYNTEWLQTGLKASLNAGNNSYHFSYVYNKTDRTFESAFGIFDFKGRFANLDGYGDYKLSETLNLIFGMNYQDLRTIDPNATVDSPEVTLISPYASLMYHPDNVSHLEFGMRYNDHSTFGSNVNYSLGASRWVSDHVKIYGHWATSFKAPNLFQLYGQFGANPDLEAQVGRSINVGLSINDIGLLDKIEIGLFDRKVDQLIIFDFASGYSNLPSQHDQGLELSIADRVNDWSLGLSYVYLLGEIDDKSGTDPLNNLFRRPKHQVNGSIAYYYNKKNKITLDVRYQGTRDDVFFDSNTFLNEEVTLAPYWLTNLKADYSLRASNLSLFAVINNLFDVDFQEIAGFGTVGRNIQVGLFVKFE